MKRPTGRDDGPGWRSCGGSCWGGRGGPEADFFAHRRCSCPRRQRAPLRDRHPQVHVADLYDHPTTRLARGVPRELGRRPRATSVWCDRLRAGAGPQSWLSCRWRRWAARQWVNLAVRGAISRACLHLVPWTVVNLVTTLLGPHSPASFELFKVYFFEKNFVLKVPMVKETHMMMIR